MHQELRKAIRVLFLLSFVAVISIDIICAKEQTKRTKQRQTSSQSKTKQTPHQDVDPQQRKKQVPLQKESQPATLTATPMTGEESAQILRKLNDEWKLVPEFSGWRYTGALRFENCFGFVFQNGARLLGESNGEDYGLRSNDEHDQMIGFLYSETDFLLDGKPFNAGAYLLLASTQELFFVRDRPGYSPPIPDFPYPKVQLKSKLPDHLVAKESNKRPRFSLLQKGSSVVLSVEGNEFRVTSDEITGKLELSGQGGAVEVKLSAGAAATPVTPAAPTGGTAASSSAPISGEWDGFADAQGRNIGFTLKLKLEGDKVSGSSESADGSISSSIPISNGSFTGGKLSFALDTGQGSITFTGMVKDGKILGNFDFAGQMSGKWDATKKTRTNKTDKNDEKLPASSSTATQKPLTIAKSKTIQSPGKETAGIALNPDGKILACGNYGDNSVYLIDVSTGSVILTLKGHTAPVTSLAFSPNGALLASTGTVNLPPKEDGSVRLWDVKTGKELFVFKTTGTSHLAFSPDGAVLAAAGGGEVKLWDVGSGSEKRIIKGIFKYVSFSPDGNLLASGGRDEQVHVINTATGEEAMKLVGHTGSVSATAFSLKGGLLASGSEDANIQLWDTATGNRLKSLTGHKSEVGFLGFSNDGSVLASLGSGINVTRQGGSFSITIGSEDKSLRFWDVKAGKEIALIEVTAGISEVSFNSDWTLMATSNAKDFIQLWSVKR